MKILIGALFSVLLFAIIFTGYFFKPEKFEIPVPICSDTIVFLTFHEVDTVYRELPMWELDSVVQNQFLQASKYLQNNAGE